MAVKRPPSYWPDPGPPYGDPVQRTSGILESRRIEYLNNGEIVDEVLWLNR